jgi:hypothetical protein
MDVSADCFPAFDLTTVFVEHSSPHIVATVRLEPAAHLGGRQISLEFRIKVATDWFEEFVAESPAAFKSAG